MMTTKQRWTGLCWLGFVALATAEPQPKEGDYYTITPLKTPEETVFEVGGLEILPDKRVAVSIRRGEIWIADGAFEGHSPEWTLFTRYLHEPLGLSWREGWLYATQRPEVTRMRDEDGDGRADVFETVSQPWGITGDYHEYAFGSEHDAEGNMYVALCLTGSFTAQTLFRGWVMKIGPDGKAVPFASGVRSPGGIGYNAEGDLFYTDNQGAWNGSSSLKHVPAGSFQGNPNGTIYYDVADRSIVGERPAYPPVEGEGSRIEAEREKIPQLVPPAVVMPHAKLGQSPTGMVADTTGGKFGPFEGQLFVGEQTYSEIQRVFLEKVNGVYQGAAFHFLGGFQSGNIALRLHEDGTLFTGGSNRGWRARGGKSESFERVRWTGKVPFEVLKMEARPKGFLLTFTRPAHTASLVDGSFKMSAYTYLYRKEYGSPEVDKIEPAVSVAAVGQDGLSVELEVDPLTKGHVHELHLRGVRDVNEQPLLHDVAFYTLNEIPAR